MSSSSDTRCVAHSMSDDPHAADLAEGPYREATAAAIRGLLDTLEAAWREEEEEGEEEDDGGAHRRGGLGRLRGGGIYVGACGAAMLLYKLAIVQRSLQGEEDSRGGGGGIGGGGASGAGAGAGSGSGSDDASSRPPLFGRSTEMLLRAALGHCKAGLEAMGGSAGSTSTTTSTTTTTTTTKRVTFLEGEAGCHALSAAILAAMGKADAAASSVERLVAMRARVASMPPSECEVLYGRCGYLHALLFARKRVGGYVAKALLPPSVFHDIVAQAAAVYYTNMIGRPSK